MISLEEIKKKLYQSISEKLDAIAIADSRSANFNELLGPTSYLLAALLQNYLRSDFDWPDNLWQDDSLFSTVTFKEEKLTIKGVMIYGIEGDTSQWVSPFIFSLVIKGTEKSPFQL